MEIKLSQLTSFKPIKLKNLSAEYDGTSVVFNSGNERAIVVLKNNKISQVNHFMGDKEIIVKTSTKSLKVGERHFQRNVDHFLIKGSHQNNLMRIGQTFHASEGGTWSSLPHEFENFPEPGFEELFFYLLSGGSCRAVQVGKGMLHDGENIDSAWIVRDKEFSQVPMGYHPVVGEPDVHVSYIWCYLCTKDEWEKV